VSIKSFPDYKHLLRENHVEYKHTFLPLLKLVFNKMVQLHIGVHMFVGFWMQHFQTGGLGEMVRHPGHNDCPKKQPPLSSFYGGMSRTVFSTPVPDITNLKARITDTFATTEDIWRTRGEKLIID
jgi:hypothetical protein